jgi:hypothetical protein
MARGGPAGGTAKVAASGTWTDPDDGVRLPAGDVHAWEPGTNQTVCGLALSRTRLARFPHVPFVDVLPESGGAADRVGHLCPRCVAATKVRRKPDHRRPPKDVW